MKWPFPSLMYNELLLKEVNGLIFPTPNQTSKSPSKSTSMNLQSQFTRMFSAIPRSTPTSSHLVGSSCIHRKLGPKLLTHRSKSPSPSMSPTCAPIPVPCKVKLWENVDVLKIPSSLPL